MFVCVVVECISDSHACSLGVFVFGTGPWSVTDLTRIHNFPFPLILPLLSFSLADSKETHTYKPLTHTPFLGLALCYVSSNSQNVYFPPLAPLACCLLFYASSYVWRSLLRDQLLLRINLPSHTQTQHEGSHTHYRQIAFITPHTLGASSAIDVYERGAHVTSGFVFPGVFAPKAADTLSWPIISDEPVIQPLWSSRT